MSKKSRNHYLSPYYQGESSYKEKVKLKKAKGKLFRIPKGTSGTFPASPFNGMQIIYNITGVSTTTSTDSEGFTTSRVLEGETTNKGVRVSGKALMGGGFGADLVVKLSDGVSPAQEFTAYIKSGWPNFNEESFDLQLQISPQATNVEVFIHMTGNYNVGTRGLEVIGNYKVPQAQEEDGFIHDGKITKPTKKTVPGVSGAGGFPTGSWNLGDNGLLLIERTSSNSVLGYYFGIKGMQSEGEFMGTIEQNLQTGLFQIDGTWTAVYPYQCISDKGRVRIVFNKEGTGLKMVYSQCGSPNIYSSMIDGVLICPGFLNVVGQNYKYNNEKYPGMVVPKSGTLVILANTNNPGILGNGLIGLYDNNQGKLDGKIIGNVWIGSWFYAGDGVDLKSGKMRVIFTLDLKNLTIIWK